MRLATLVAVAAVAAVASHLAGSALPAQKPDAALRNDYGAMLLVLDRLAEARTQFEAGLASAPLYVFLHYNAALAADRVGDGAGALARDRALLRVRGGRAASAGGAADGDGPVVQRTETDQRIAALSRE